jgi:hypothetical protein
MRIDACVAGAKHAVGKLVALKERGFSRAVEEAK